MRIVFQILFVIVSWFVVSMGWSIIYYYFNKFVRKIDLEDDQCDRFGNRMYLFWIFQLVFGIFFFGFTDLPENYFNMFMNYQLYYIMLSVIGFFLYNVRD